ncbi:MAG: NUDIX domain-containing protein [Planctomycetota bacterium]|nr:MAG: NUDIX domain-containing protein [Planctomycetota bacterium]REJ93367.1 MAG: NUDIX domain-containing protein [Planctomycetota bacterium]REK20744.1 MAG: NUDIX domain-containing protein [Planctomycetota bacterium]REK38074.1 MAG: NUDIX domain-containing protein [Planctomycetota bacterium]
MENDSITKVGIAVVEHEGRYLVGVRESSAPLGGLAEFPGGKCRPGESAAECAIRECAEETDLLVEIVEPLLNRRYDYPHGAVDLHFFLCAPANGMDADKLKGTFEWIELAALREREFPPANRPVIDRLVDRDQRPAQRGVT